jgi:hypothetical protein
MSSGVLYIVLGVLILVNGGWYTPRVLRRVAERARARGENPERIDRLLGSRAYRVLLPTCGALIILCGIWLLATGN